MVIPDQARPPPGNSSASKTLLTTMPALSGFPEPGHRAREPSAAPNRLDPRQFVQDFRTILDQIRQSKKARLDKMSTDLNVVFDQGGVATDQEIVLMETLEDDIELIEERYRKLGKVVAGVHPKTGRPTLEKILDGETRSWTNDDLKVLVDDLQVSDGTISGKKARSSNGRQDKTMQASAKENAERRVEVKKMTEAGPTKSQRRMEKGPMFDVDKVRVSEATKQKVLEEHDDEADEQGEDSDESSGKAPSNASSYAARLAKKTKDEMKKRNNSPEEIIEVHQTEKVAASTKADQNENSKVDGKGALQPVQEKAGKAKRKSEQTKSKRLLSQSESAGLLRGALLPDPRKKQFAPQQVDASRTATAAISRQSSSDDGKSSLHSLFSASEDEGAGIPSEWLKPGAWPKETGDDVDMQDVGDVEAGEPLHDAEQHPSHPGSPRRRASNATSQESGSSSSSGLFVTSHKKRKSLTTKPSQKMAKESSPAASGVAPPPRRPSRTPGTRGKSEFMRSLLERNEDSYALPDSPPRDRSPAPTGEEAARRAAAFYTAEPKTKEIMLLAADKLSEQKQKKRPADEAIDGALGAFGRGEQGKAKVRKGGEEVGRPGSRGPSETRKTPVEMGPMKWPGQEVKKAKGKGKGRKQ
ncbi:hypothetical protein CB0940_06761 [Cercospora beticola]|uniref:Uncharacterized protein n=1 Tax=Cercospora beticola TaxID=122368 RepID=A0A2G5H7F5_CERBT|nr:hypothetical protein CB0940_06761 [Cercospora beticola]PIA88474.1 hypothetical protein CB0940_06761 [Cercospora beticola]WPB02674.1 hypothetical protein RHO25_007310 [Cercospora beticola]